MSLPVPRPGDCTAASLANPPSPPRAFLRYAALGARHGLNRGTPRQDLVRHERFFFPCGRGILVRSKPGNFRIFEEISVLIGPNTSQPRVSLDHPVLGQDFGKFAFCNIIGDPGARERGSTKAISLGRTPLTSSDKRCGSQEQQRDRARHVVPGRAVGRVVGGMMDRIPRPFPRERTEWFKYSRKRYYKK